MHEKDKAIDEFDLMAEVAHECKALGKIKDTVGTLRGKVHRLNVCNPSFPPPSLFFLLIFTCITSSYHVLYRYSSINIDNNIIIRCLSPIYNFYDMQFSHEHPQTSSLIVCTCHTTF